MGIVEFILSDLFVFIGFIILLLVIFDGIKDIIKAIKK